MIRFTRSIENKYVTLFLVAIIIVLVFILFTKTNFVSNSTLYKLNSDCAQQAQSFAKDKSKNESFKWEIEQSGFYKAKNSCFAEFRLGIMGDGTLIYDLTHSKEIVFNLENTKKYEDVKMDVFGK